MSPTRRPLWIACSAIAVAAFVALGAGLLPALGLSTPVTYFACVGKTGVLKLVSKSTKCPSGERKISWNSVGPQGPQGKPGTNGVVNGFVDKGPANSLLSSSGPTTVAALQLAAGHYVLSFSVSFSNSDTTTDGVDCNLLSGSTFIDEGAVTLAAGATGGVALGGASLGGKTVVLCSTGGTQVGDFNPILTAIPVNALKVTSTLATRPSGKPRSSAG